jgi:hypothetical protein
VDVGEDVLFEAVVSDGTLEVVAVVVPVAAVAAVPAGEPPPVAAPAPLGGLSP